MAKKFITKVEEKLIEDLLSEKLSSFRPSVSFKENTYNRLLKKMNPRKSWTFDFHRWISVGTASLGVFLCLGVTTGYAYFSPNVNSESNLYFLKKSVENVEYNLAFSEEDKIKTLVKFNEKRKEEIAVLAEEGIEDKLAIKEIEVNLNKSVLLLGKIEDPKVKEELLVLINPTPVTAATAKEIDEVEDKDEEDDKPVIVEEDPKKSPIWNLGIILPPQPTLNLSKDVLKLEVGDDDDEDGEDSAEFEPQPVDDFGAGGFIDDYDVDFGDAFEDSAPLIIPLQPDIKLEEPVCRQMCKSGATQFCKGGVQTCGDFDKDGCTEWGQCLPVKEDEEDDDDDGQIFFDPVIEPIEIEDPVITPTPTITPTPIITPIKLTPIKVKPLNFNF